MKAQSGGMATEASLAERKMGCWRRVSSNTASVRTPSGRTAGVLMRGLSGQRKPRARGGITESHIVDYKAHRIDEGYAERTVYGRLQAMRQFCRFLVLEGCLDEDPTRRIDFSACARSLPRILSVDQVENLLAQPEQRGGYTWHRDAALLGLLYASALRASEVYNLKVQDLHREERTVRVWSKGAKQRTGSFARLPARKKSGHQASSQTPSQVAAGVCHGAQKETGQLSRQRPPFRPELHRTSGWVRPARAMLTTFPLHADLKNRVTDNLPQTDERRRGCHQIPIIQDSGGNLCRIRPRRV